LAGNFNKVILKIFIFNFSYNLTREFLLRNIKNGKYFHIILIFIKDFIMGLASKNIGIDIELKNKK